MAWQDNPAFQQHLHRRTQIMRDQHERPWLVVIDMNDRGYSWVGHPTPQFTVPHPAFMPTSQYLKAVKGRLDRLHIDYDRMLADVRRGNETWVQLKRQAAQANYPQAPMAAFSNPSPDFLALLGPRPFPEEFVRAMRTGKSRWILGLSNEKPAWLTGNFELMQWLERRATPAVAEDEDEGAEVSEEIASDLAIYGDAEEASATSEPSLDPEDAPYADLEEQYDPDATGGKVERRGPGRPKGSKNRPKEEVAA